MTRSHGATVPSLLALVVVTAAARSQCDPTFAAAPSLPGTDLAVRASVSWDPDGPGPAPAVVAIAGRFTIAGNAIASGVAAWDPATGAFAALGPIAVNSSNQVNALAALPNGDLVAGGAFTTASGAPAANLARWNGTMWSPLGGGTNGAVHALAVLPNGDLIAGGTFTSAGGVPVSRLARWNGTAWSVFGDVTSGGTVQALRVLANGDLVAGGTFSSIAGGAVQNVALWSGGAWSPLGTPDLAVRSLLQRANGELVAGGSWPGGNSVRRWNGTAWVPLGTLPSNATVHTLAQLPNGDVVAGGDVGLSGLRSIARWDGAAWRSVDVGPDGSVHTLLTLGNGDLLAGGEFGTAGRLGANNLARWSATGGWTPLANGPDALVRALLPLPDGGVLVGGAFRSIGTVPARGVARLQGGTWSALANGIDIVVNALARLPGGDVVAAGYSLTSNPGASPVHRWNGAAWIRLDGLGSSQYPANVRALLVRANGDLIAGGTFGTAPGQGGVARWTGTSWVALGSMAEVVSLAELPNGDLLAAHASSIHRWTGTSWLPLTWNTSDVQVLAVLGNTLYAGGGFTVAGGVAANRVARWNGTIWQPLGAGLGGAVHALALLPDGDVVAAGAFTTAGGAPANRLARWDGTTWTPFGAGLGGPAGAIAYAVAFSTGGELVAGGNFTTANGVAAARVARLTTPCQPAVATLGSGCSGAAGPVTLAASSLPWAGSTFRSVANGLPANALAVAVAGTASTSVPLASLLPQGAPGCSLLVVPLQLDALLPAGGTVALALPLPPSPSLVGQLVHQQLLGVELTATGAIGAVTASNALSLTLGSF
jgi:hypothetical protein